MAGEGAVHRGAAHVLVELVVVHVHRVARGAGVADHVVVAVAAGDLDGVAGDVVAAAVVDVRGAAGVDAGVAVAVGLAVLVQPVVAGEGQEAVLVVPAGQHVVDDEAVAREDVQRVEGGALGGEVAEVDAVGLVRADPVQLLVLGVDDHVLAGGSGAFDLEVGLAEDGDQVLVVAAGRLLLVGQDLVAERGVGGLERGALTGRCGERGLLLVEAGQDRDVHARAVHGVDRRLEVAEAVLLAAFVEGEVALLEGVGEGGYPALECGPVGLADDQVGLALAVGGYGAGAVGELDGALLVRARGGRGDEE